MAFETVGGYLRDVRDLLQDQVPPYRYSTISLIRGLNLTLMEVRRLRPDLLMDYLDALPQYDWVDQATQNTDGDESETVQTPDGDDDDNPTWSQWVPIEIQFRQALTYGISGHAMRRDQEDVEDERATGHIKTFENLLTEVQSTKGMSPPKG